jgi:hypothetical protein
MKALSRVIGSEEGEACKPWKQWSEKPDRRKGERVGGGGYITDGKEGLERE